MTKYIVIETHSIDAENQYWTESISNIEPRRIRTTNTIVKKFTDEKSLTAHLALNAKSNIRLEVFEVIRELIPVVETTVSFK